MKAGIKETREVIAAGSAYCKALVNAAADGKINLLDARHLLAPVKATMTAVQGAENVLTELKDLDAAEIDALIDDAAALAVDANAAVEALKKLKPVA